ncbi:MAG: isoprenylcysteine carboxylmethyltransferase family protein [Elusimicrobiota bacterium]
MMSWKDFAAKNRLRLGLLFVVCFLIFAKVGSLLGFILGLEVCLLGEFFRIWSAGYIKKSELLCICGPYSYVRNPLYWGSFLIGLGFCLGTTSRQYWLTAIIFWLTFIVLFALVYYSTIKKEENYLQNKFGDEFSQYRAAVPVFFPRFSPWVGSKISEFSWRQVFANQEHRTFGFVLLVWLILGLKFYFT